MLVSLWQFALYVTLQRGYIATWLRCNVVTLRCLQPLLYSMGAGCRRHTVTRLGGGRYDLSPSECIWSEGMSRGTCVVCRAVVWQLCGGVRGREAWRVACVSAKRREESREI